MKRLAAALACLPMLWACVSENDRAAPETRPMEDGNADVTEIRNLSDIEKYAGQQIYIEGIFKVHPQYRGKHGYVVLDSGLKVYLPHIDQHYAGTNWFKFENQRVYVGGRLHSYVDTPIDGMKGPYLENPTPLAPADSVVPPSEKEEYVPPER